MEKPSDNPRAPWSRRRCWGTIAGATATLFVLLWIGWQYARTPRHEGRTMTAWFDETTARTNALGYCERLQSTAIAPSPSFPRGYDDPGVEAFRHFGTNGTAFLAAELGGRTNAWTRLDPALRKWLPRFTHGWLPAPPDAAKRKRTALFLLAQLGQNALAHEHLLQCVRAQRYDPDLRSKRTQIDLRVPILVLTGGRRETTIENLLTLGHNDRDWLVVMRMLARYEFRVRIQRMLPRLLAISRAARPHEVQYFFQLFESAAPGAPETLEFHRFCVRKYGYSRSVGPLCQFAPDEETLVGDLFTLMKKGDRTRSASGRRYPALAQPGRLPAAQETAVRALNRLAANRHAEVMRGIPPLLTSTNPVVRAAGVKLTRGRYVAGPNTETSAELDRSIHALKHDASPMVRHQVERYLAEHDGNNADPGSSSKKRP